MRRLTTLIAGVTMLVAYAPSAGAAHTITGSYPIAREFVVQPGDPASCAFPITISIQGRGTYQVLLDSQGTPSRLLLHDTWTGTASANGKHLIEHAAQNDDIDLTAGSFKNTGQIHDQLPFAGVVIHDVGLLRFDPDGNLVFEAGPHQGLEGDVASVCAALS